MSPVGVSLALIPELTMQNAVRLKLFSAQILL